MRLIDISPLIEARDICEDMECRDCELEVRDCESMMDLLMKMPTIDAVPVKHGRWNGYNAEIGWTRSDGSPVFLCCSVCNGTVLNNGSAHWNYCPNCGARMDGDV